MARAGGDPDHYRSPAADAVEGRAALRRVKLFAALPDDELRQVAAKVIVRRHPANDELVNLLDDTTDIYFVLSGRLRVTLYSREGRETIFRDVREGELFGEMAAIDGRPRSANVSTLSECAVATMTAADFRTLVTTNPTVCMELLKYFTQQVRTLTERVYQLGTWTVKHRLFAELLKLGGYGQTAEHRLVIEGFPTHLEIASRISTHREAVSKELSQLQKSGVIRREGRTMILLRPDLLAEHLHLT